MNATRPISWPGSDFDDQDASVVIDLFTQASQANLDDPRRRGSCLTLPSKGTVLMTGDLHDNHVNFQKIVRTARLKTDTDHYLVLHELIHGGSFIHGMDFSFRLLAKAASLKLAYPQQVFFLLANHDLAQLCGDGIIKNGQQVIQAFDDGLEYLYNDDTPQVREALFRFFRSMLLAVHCENGVMLSHSIPSPNKIKHFDPDVIYRPYTDEDLASNGSASLMVWGRHHDQATADTLSKHWGCEQFVMGHQPAEMGYETEAENMLIILSEHSHGQILPIDLATRYTQETLIENLIPLAGISS